MANDNNANITNNIVIHMYNSKDRKMDKSPAQLAKELKRSINTVKSKICSLELSVKPVNQKLPDPQNIFIIDKDNRYQLYNYECLPILKAYIGSKSDSASPRDLPSFYQTVINELEKDPQQVICENYLFNQEDFRKFYLQKPLETAIHTRLENIRALSENLDVYPADQAVSPHYTNSSLQAIAYLDRLIYDLADLSPADTKVTSSPSEHPHNASSGTPAGINHPTPATPRDCAKKWCSDLVQLRENILCPGREIQYSPSFAQSNAQAIEKLLYGQLDERTKQVATNVRTISKNIKASQSFAYKTTSSNIESLKEEIQRILLQNMEPYLTAVFEMDTTPPFKTPSDTSLPGFVLQLVYETFEKLCFASETLERYYSNIRVWHLLNEAFPKEESSVKTKAFSIVHINELNKLRSNTAHSIQAFWKELLKDESVPINNSIDIAFLHAINSAVVCEQMLKTATYERPILDSLKAVVMQSKNTPTVDQLMYASVITLETFWRKQIELHATYIANRCAEYQCVLRASNADSISIK